MYVYICVFFLYDISEGIYDLPDEIETGTYLGSEAYFKHYQPVLIKGFGGEGIPPQRHLISQNDES